MEELDKLNGNIIKNAPISIMVISKRGEIVFVNPFFKKVSGSRHPLNRKIKDIPFFIREGLCPLYEKLLIKGEPFKKENCRTVDMKGRPVYINITAVPLKNSKGAVNSALSMAMDVTREFEMNLKLEGLNNKLEKRVSERTVELSKINEKLNRYLKMKTEFIADASHELRTPLAIIKLQMELLSSEIKNRNFSGIFSAVDGEIDKITEILSDLTFMTSIEEGRQKIKMEEIDLAKTISHAVQRMSFLAATKDIKIAFIYDGALMIRGDAEKIERLFLNLMRNAIKYGKKGGEVKIDAKIGNKELKITVSDNGIGIPKEDLPHIFDRFYRSDLCVKYGKSGFGLGLAICRWIAEQHKGSISVKSIFDKGSSFVVKLPIS